MKKYNLGIIAPPNGTKKIKEPPQINKTRNAPMQEPRQRLITFSF